VSRTADLVRTGVRGLGQTLITVGVVLLLFVFYELQVTGLVTAREQGKLTEALEDRWAAPVPAPLPGEPIAAPAPVEMGQGIAVLRIPRLGQGWNDAPPVVVEGVSVEDLKKGPGHMPGTALPGEVGNVVLSGHRTTYGQPFNGFGELQPGDAVVVETRDSWHTYRITTSEIVAPDAIEVTYPVPREPDATPTRSLLTMTTCHPKYSAQQRLVVFAELERSDLKSGGAPPALQEV
jgi:sortase A